MTEEQKENALADCLEEYHRQRARGEVVDLARFREELGDLYEEFFELVAAETAIDEALDSASEQALPQNWGPYLLLGEIGRGAAGVVYEAMHRELGRKVALKVLRTGVDTDATARERFRREAQALAQVRHDNIVEIYEFGEMGDRLYYAMSLVEGESLAQLNKQDRRPDPQSLSRGLAGIADALHALHEVGIVHRDVKPSNIMIGPDGRYLLADFGLARTDLAETMTRTGDALGTPLYMSPEQMLGNRDAVEARTDIYGLGATMYQMLTGAPPFKTDNLHALMRMVLTQRPQNPRAIVPELPPGCSSIAMKCLEKESGDRYATAADLAADLRAFADGERVSGKPLTGTQRTLRLIKRRPVVSALAVAATVLIAFGIAKIIEPPPPPETIEAKVSFLIASNQDAKVSIGGETHAAPLRDHPVEVGRTYDVTISATKDGYVPFEKQIVGKKHPQEFEFGAFQPASATDGTTLRDTLNALGVPQATEPRRHEQHRGDWGAPIEMLFPRGLVLREDIKQLRFLIDERFDPRDSEWRGTFRILRGKDVLYEDNITKQPLDLDSPPQIFEVPQDVLTKIQPGDTIRWGFFPRRKNKPSYTASFTLAKDGVAEEVAERIAAVEAKMEGWAPDVRTVLAGTAGVEVLLAAGLAQGAYERLQPLLGTDGERPGIGAFEPAPHLSMWLVELERKVLTALYPKKDHRESTSLYAFHNLDHRRVYSQEEWDAFQAEQEAAQK